MLQLVAFEANDPIFSHSRQGAVNRLAKLPQDAVFSVSYANASGWLTLGLSAKSGALNTFSTAQ
jgi:hypothetical protein